MLTPPFFQAHAEQLWILLLHHLEIRGQQRFLWRANALLFHSNLKIITYSIFTDQEAKAEKIDMKHKGGFALRYNPGMLLHNMFHFDLLYKLLFTTLSPKMQEGSEQQKVAS